MINLDITIGKLAEYIEEYSQLKLFDNKEISIHDYGIYVPTPSGNVKVNSFIKKYNLPMIKLQFDNGYCIKVAENHVLQQHGKDVYAKMLSVNDSLTHKKGSIVVTTIESIDNEDCFDLSLPNPHLYFDANGLMHHNTIITAALSHSCEPFGRTLVIVPNKSLVTQTEEDYKNLNLDVGVYFGDRKELGHTHTIVTWQSLNNIIKNTADGVGDITIQEFIEGVVALVIDECHMAKADVLKSMLSGSMSKISIRWGLTGTIPKEKFASEALLTCIGPVINKLAATDLQDRGVLASCHVHVVQLQDHAMFKNYQSELKYLLEQENRLDTIANIVDKVKESGNTLVLVDRITAGKELVKRLPNSVFVSGTTSNKKRKEEYADVAVQDEKIIVATYGVAAVGINIPRIFNLVFIEPGKSFVRVIQSIGRGLRKAEDKDFVQIWDITSSCKFSKRHLTQRKTFYKEANYPFTMEKLDYK